MKQKGQMILMLILIMTVALAIGLSIVQKSLVDVSTSSKVEQSSRAFSAAEAGIEKALRDDATIQNFDENSSKITVIEDTRFPRLDVTKQQEALEYPPLAKEDVAQVWLADPAANLPDCISPPPPALPFVCYKHNQLDIYWGNPAATDNAALEITLIWYDGTKYTTENSKWFFDPDVTRSRSNGFNNSATCLGYPVGSNTYKCKIRLNFTDEQVAGLMLIRARLLYNSSSQPFAVQAVNICAGCSIPSQSRKITSTGVAGETQRKVQVFQLYKVVPPYFDYAIFSAGEISK